MTTALPSVLCPVDFSEPSRSALCNAAAVADHFGARLTVLAVDDPLLSEVAANSGHVPSLAEATVHELERFCRETLTGFESGPKTVEFKVRIGKPATEILHEASELRADLIVMSSHGRSGMGKMFFGSTTERVLRETSVPVFITPDTRPPVASLSEIARSHQSHHHAYRFDGRLIASTRGGCRSGSGVVDPPHRRPRAGADLRSVHGSFDDTRRRCRTSGECRGESASDDRIDRLWRSRRDDRRDGRPFRGDRHVGRGTPCESDRHGIAFLRSAWSSNGFSHLSCAVPHPCIRGGVAAENDSLGHDQCRRHIHSRHKLSASAWRSTASAGPDASTSMPFDASGILRALLMDHRLVGVGWVHVA